MNSGRLFVNGGLDFWFDGGLDICVSGGLDIGFDSGGLDFWFDSGGLDFWFDGGGLDIGSLNSGRLFVNGGLKWTMNTLITV